jgi:hypothetical protein
MARAPKKIEASATIPAISTDPEVEPEVGGEIPVVTIDAMAVSLQVPANDSHPNKMPFSGILTRIDEASDSPPNGSGGKRILVTRAAAEGALASLLGMAVGLKRSMDGHAPKNKIGVITAARIDGNALHIEGFIYASDFPDEAIRIHLRQADLGFSFEAQQVKVQSTETDPVVVTHCIFTGAAILLKNDAAYKTTAIAAAAEKEFQMDEVTAAVTAALQAALAPVTDQLAALKASQDAHAVALDELRKPHAAIVAKVEPHAARLEASAAQLEHDGMTGSAAQLRKVAAAMRADAELGMLPRGHEDRAQLQVAAAAAVPPKIDEAPEFKALKAAADTAIADLKAAREAIDAQNTVITDLKNGIAASRPSPERKTLTPAVQNVLSRIGITDPGEGAAGVPIGQVDAALDKMAGLSTSQRIQMKKLLFDGGLLADNNRQI